MNDKITFPRLATMLAEQSGRSKRFSEDFLREFFAVISETLEAGESVKVKGLGTFRLSRVEPRKSIDVTTGQPMEITGHSKVVFTPAKELAEAVNAPFEAFTAIEIGDDADISTLISPADIALQKSQDDYAEDQESAEEVDMQTTVSNAYEAVEVINQPETSEEPESYNESEDHTSQEDPEPEKPEPEQPESTDASMTSEDSEDTEDTEVIEDQAYSEEATDTEVSTDTEGSTDSEKDQDEEAENEDDLDYEDLDPKKFRRKKWKKILLVSLGAALFALVATFAIWYLVATNDFNRYFNQTASNTIQTTETGYEVDRETPSIDTATSELEITDEKPSETEQMAEEPEVPTAPSDALVYDTVSTTRYLTTIAKAHYGNYNLWPYIYEENKAILGHPDRIRPGTPVVVPKLSKYGIDPSRKEDVDKAKKMGVEIYSRYGKKI